MTVHVAGADGIIGSLVQVRDRDGTLHGTRLVPQRGKVLHRHVEDSVLRSPDNKGVPYRIGVDDAATLLVPGQREADTAQQVRYVRILKAFDLHDVQAVR